MAGSGGGGPFFPVVDLHEPEPEETLVAFVETLRTLAALPLYLELVLDLLYLPLNAVKPDELVVVVDTLAMEGA